MTAAQLREAFLKFFEENGHTRVPSSSLIPTGDNTLLFTNAGMVQFKNVFTGTEKRSFRRAVTAQKCLRVSGKHNDLENVGHTARHHTFFEMMGNFSFGDYFKEDAIAFGWKFLADVVGLPKEKLYVTVYKDDEEAVTLWGKVAGLKPQEVIRLGEKDNFWSMGDTGPCGPCSEIHFDQGAALGCGRPDCGPDCDCDRFLELWNLVFMQFDRDASGNMTPLPKPSIDTGLGLERLAAVAQGKPGNWESDLFGPVIARLEELCGKKCLGGDMDSIAIRVMADHARAAAFLIADGVFPSNEGRGYVLRRILRRALRYGKLVGLNEPFLYDSALVTVSHMGSAYPELTAQSLLIEKVIRNEEERFLETLARGLVLFEEEADRVRGDGQSTLPGSVAFRLYDTFGFPLDLTEDLARESGLAVDSAGFDGEMAAQRQRARQSWEAMQGEDATAVKRILSAGIRSDFTGYETLSDFGVVTAIIRDGKEVETALAGEKVDLVTDRTPFYGESGGQVGDHGTMRSNGCELTVEDATKPLADLTIHRCFVKIGSLSVGARVEMTVHTEIRSSIAANHTATHILQWALRQVLGDHVKQSGSLVTPERLRFDFTHFAAVSEDELVRVEDLVNERIRENGSVGARLTPIKEAMNSGAMALFGEKYGDTVRLVSVGGFSKELCGGTHVQNTGEIGLFKIVGEGGIAAGVRRIEAVTARSAEKFVKSLDRDMKLIAQRLKCSTNDVPARVERLLEERRAGEREIETLKAKLASKLAGDILDGVREINGVKVLARLLDDISSPKDLREYADRVRDRLDSGVALLGASNDGKALLIALVTKDLTSRFHAGNIVKQASVLVGGSGGGRPDMAQAGGPNVGQLAPALESVFDYVESKA
ncbi:MAG: alanine--tRNA ligase [Pseudomonadota bacterium]